MKQHWLDIQSFLSDQRILRTIDNLAIAIKFEMVGIKDGERAEFADEARTTLKQFFQ